MCLMMSQKPPLWTSKGNGLLLASQIHKLLLSKIVDLTSEADLPSFIAKLRFHIACAQILLASSISSVPGFTPTVAYFVFYCHFSVCL